MPAAAARLQLHLGCCSLTLTPAAQGLLPAMRMSEPSAAAHRLFSAAGSIDTVGTAGRVSFVPNLVNSVPRQATLEIDVRDIDGARRDRVVAAIRTAVAAIAKRRGVKHSSELINQDDPATCSDQVTFMSPI